MNVTIIGAGGRMGSWFTRYFYARGYNLYLNDVNRDALQSLSSSLSSEGVRVTTVNSSLLDGYDDSDGISIINGSDLIILSLPMDVMPKAVRSVARYMHKGSILAEISSLKHDVHRTLRRVAESYGINPLSIHPLFGPGADINTSNRFVLVPVIDGREEESIARMVFPNAMVIRVDDADEHDRAMALVLGMVYAMNIAFADLLRDCDDMALCKELAGSTFTLQSLIFEGILNDDPRLFSSLLTNKHVKRYLKRFIASNEHLLACIDARDKDSLERAYSRVKKKVSRCTDIDGSYRLMYRVLKEINDKDKDLQ